MTASPLLQGNIEAIRRRNPQLAAALETHAATPSKIEMVSTRENVPTIRYTHLNGDRTVQTWVHSRYTPITEASRFASRHITESQLLLYGFGLGYHIQQLAQRISPQTRLRVLECNMDLLHTAFSLLDYAPLLQLPNVELLGPMNNQDALAMVEAALNRDIPVAVYKPALSCLDDTYADLKLFFTHYLIPGESEPRQRLAADNHYANLQLQTQPIHTLFNRHPQKTAVLVSSGPSLNDMWDVLPEIRPHTVLISVGSALRFLVERKLIPDYVVLLDAIPWIRNQLNGCEHLDAPLLFSNFTSTLAVQAYTGPRYMYFCEPLGGIPDEDVLSIGGSVATAALAIALKMGVNRVIFAGQDLCHSNGMHHASGTWLSNVTAAADLPNLPRVKNIQDEWVSTEPKLLQYRKWLEQTIAQNPGVTFFNLSSRGLPIVGAPTLDRTQLFQLFNGLT